MKLNEIKEGYFKKLCQEIFDDTTFLSRVAPEDFEEIAGESDKAIAKELGCNLLDLKSVWAYWEEEIDDDIPTRDKFEKMKKFLDHAGVLKNLPKPFYQKSMRGGLKIYILEYEGIKFAYEINAPDTSLFYICKDSLN